MSDERPGTAPQGLEPGLLTARKLLAWRGAPPSLRAPAAVLLTHQASLFRALAPRFRTRSVRGLSAELRPLPGTAGRLGAAGRLGVGGPAVAVLVEELAVLGVKQIVAVDIGASIDAALRSGTVVVAGAALCGDGTSRHYAPGEARVAADEALARRIVETLSDDGLPHQPKTVWSTDAPYRETAALIMEARERGAVMIDMETAALYASCAALGIAAVAVLVVADEIFDDWRPPADAPLIQSQLKRAAVTVKRCLLS